MRHLLGTSFLTNKSFPKDAEAVMGGSNLAFSGTAPSTLGYAVMMEWNQLYVGLVIAAVKASLSAIVDTLDVVALPPHVLDKILTMALEPL